MRSNAELYGRFLADHQRAEAQARPPRCPHCGSGTDCHHSRWGQCHVCDFGGTRHAWDPEVVIDFRLGDVAWSEAVSTRKRGGQTPRQFFNRLRLSAKIALMRELRARQQAASAGMGRITPTMRWLERGLKPHAL